MTKFIGNKENKQKTREERKNEEGRRQTKINKWIKGRKK
jgi:hypothetical protein